MKVNISTMTNFADYPDDTVFALDDYVPEEKPRQAAAQE